MPFEDEVVAAVDGARPVFERLGAHLEDAFPDLAGARAVFLTTRAKGFAEDLGSLLAGDRDRIKATVVWEIERGRAITDDHLVRARETRAAIDRRVAAFFRRFDALVLPVSQVAPFPVEQEYPTAVAGVPMETYLDWMESCWAITVTGCPSLAVRCGTTAAGLPVGLQIVGAPGEDLAVLRLGAAFERARDA
jgi:amidase